VAGCCECGDEPSGSYATELVTCIKDSFSQARYEIKLLKSVQRKWHQSRKECAVPNFFDNCTRIKNTTQPALTFNYASELTKVTKIKLAAHKLMYIFSNVFDGHRSDRLQHIYRHRDGHEMNIRVSNSFETHQ
jgi:hypothetical protein